MTAESEPRVSAERVAAVLAEDDGTLDAAEALVAFMSGYGSARVPPVGLLQAVLRGNGLASRTIVAAALDDGLRERVEALATEWALGGVSAVTAMTHLRAILAAQPTAKEGA